MPDRPTGFIPNPSYWASRRVVVTGGAGFLGTYVVEALNSRGCGEVFVPRSRDYDLRTEEAVERLYRDATPDLVLHLAAVVGGIGINRKHPGRFFYENLKMGLNLIEGARRAGTDKFVAIGTVCSYPKHTPVPFKEENLWTGYPEETNAPYGLAKKMMLVQEQAYREEYGFNGVYLIPVNLFGPRDNFDPESSHVIPALIRKFIEAQESGAARVEVWGSGEATREFLYAEDAAEGILLASEFYDGREPVNLGSGEEVSIRELAERIQSIVGYSGEIVWDPMKPDGQPRRKLDISRAKTLFGFVAKTGLENGLQRVVEWYRSTTRPKERA